jgi:NADPH:quinone reductase-like Zn-dependent oxidoreductase
LPIHLGTVLISEGRFGGHGNRKPRCELPPRRSRPGECSGLSETQSGGYTRYQRVKGQWLTKVPERFSTQQAMAIGTAGYTAALCVEAIEK